MSVCTYECSHLQRPWEGIGSLRGGITGHCETLDACAGNLILVLCSSNVYS